MKLNNKEVLEKLRVISFMQSVDVIILFIVIVASHFLLYYK